LDHDEWLLDRIICDTVGALWVLPPYGLHSGYRLEWASRLKTPQGNPLYDMGRAFVDAWNQQAGRPKAGLL